MNTTHPHWQPKPSSGSSPATPYPRPRPGHPRALEPRPVDFKTGTQKTLWQSWLALSPSTRMIYGSALAVFSVAVLAAQDLYTRTQKDATAKPVSREPSRFRISTIDKPSAK